MGYKKLHCLNCGLEFDQFMYHSDHYDITCISCDHVIIEKEIKVSFCRPVPKLLPCTITLDSITQYTINCHRLISEISAITGEHEKFIRDLAMHQASCSVFMMLDVLRSWREHVNISQGEGPESKLSFIDEDILKHVRKFTESDETSKRE